MLAVATQRSVQRRWWAWNMEVEQVDELAQSIRVDMLVQGCRQAKGVSRAGAGAQQRSLGLCDRVRAGSLVVIAFRHRSHQTSVFQSTQSLRAYSNGTGIMFKSKTIVIASEGGLDQMTGLGDSNDRYTRGWRAFAEM